MIFVSYLIDLLNSIYIEFLKQTMNERQILFKFNFIKTVVNINIGLI